MKRRTLRTKPAGEPRQGLSWTPSSMVTIGVLVFGAFVIGPQLSDLITMQTQIAQLNANIAKSKEQLADLADEKKRWDDPVFIRSQARDRLFYVMPGEISYLVLDADGLNLSDTSGTVGDMLAKAKNSSNFSQSIGTTKKDWAKGLLQSVLRAGLDQPVNNNKASATN